MPELADIVWWKWLIAAISAWSIGVAKTGVPGVGVMAVPLFVLAVGDARVSAAALLPILIVADLFGVAFYRRFASAEHILQLIPWVLAGLATGALVLGQPERTLRLLVGVILVIMLLLQFLRMKEIHLLPEGSRRLAAIYGFSAGFSTMVANAAGPVMGLYLLSRRLPREVFVGTGTWFFFFVNLAKAPVFAWHELFSQRTLLFDVFLLPAVVSGALSGRWLMQRIPQKTFEQIVLGLAVLATGLMFV
jgi:uncharacterized protein